MGNGKNNNVERKGAFAKDRTRKFKRLPLDNLIEEPYERNEFMPDIGKFPSRIPGMSPNITYAGSAKDTTKEFKRELKLEKKIGNQKKYSSKQGLSVLLSGVKNNYNFTLIVRAPFNDPVMSNELTKSYIKKYFVKPKYERV